MSLLWLHMIHRNEISDVLIIVHREVQRWIHRDKAPEMAAAGGDIVLTSSASKDTALWQA